MATSRAVTEMIKVKFQLSHSLLLLLFAEYKRLLTSDALLNVCLLGEKKLHPGVWRYCLKHNCANNQILDFAVAKAVLDYNVGYVNGHLGDELKVSMSSITRSSLEERDIIKV